MFCLLLKYMPKSWPIALLPSKVKVVLDVQTSIWSFHLFPIQKGSCILYLFPIWLPSTTTTSTTAGKWAILYHQPVSVRIYNRWGQTVFETDSYQNNWPTTSLSSGTHFYRVSSFGKEWKGWMEVK